MPERILVAIQEEIMEKQSSALESGTVAVNKAGQAEVFLKRLAVESGLEPACNVILTKAKIETQPKQGVV